MTRRGIGVPRPRPDIIGEHMMLTTLVLAAGVLALCAWVGVDVRRAIRRSRQQLADAEQALQRATAERIVSTRQLRAHERAWMRHHAAAAECAAAATTTGAARAAPAAATGATAVAATAAVSVKARAPAELTASLHW